MKLEAGCNAALTGSALSSSCCLFLLRSLYQPQRPTGPVYYIFLLRQSFSFQAPVCLATLRPPSLIRLGPVSFPIKAAARWLARLITAFSHFKLKFSRQTHAYTCSPSLSAVGQQLVILPSVNLKKKRSQYKVRTFSVSSH